MAQEVAALKRRVAMLERPTAGGPQVGESYYAAGAGGLTNGTPQTIGAGITVTVNVPSSDSRVLMWYSARGSMSNGTTNSTLYLYEATDFPVGAVLASILGQTSATIVAPFYTPANDATKTMSGYWTTPIFPYLGAGSPTAPDPTPGDRTYELMSARVAGAGTYNYQELRLWIAVI
jgi:hypothetical protein